MSIFVTNNSDMKLLDGYAGVRYEFKPGTTVEIPDEAARHIFGYGDDNKVPYLARLGWMVTNNDLDSGMERLSHWELTTEPPKKNQSLSPLVEKVPLPSKQGAKGNVLKAVS